MIFKDYYQILEIPQSASEDDIKKAYKKQALKWHPDRNKDRNTTIEMQDINEAYIALTDKEFRLKYDIEYNRYKHYQQAQQKSSYKRTSQFYNDTDYTILDDLLAKWMKNARNKAIEITKTTIK